MNRDQVDDGAPEDLVRLAEIGSGGSAIVYRAMHARSGELVALKMWRAPLDDQSRERFLRETDVLRQLSGHPNVVRLKRAEAPAGAPAWITTELCEESLAARLLRGPVPLQEAFSIADDILGGLAAIHAAGHLHRDLKPQNMLLTGGRAKLCDLGVTGVVGGVTSNNLAGTGPYIAPELARQQPGVGSDIYAVALSLDELFGAEASAEVSALLTRAASARPSDRPDDVATFRDALMSLRPSAALPTSDRTTEKSASSAGTDERTPRKRALRPLLIGFAVLVLLTGGTATAWARGWSPFGAQSDAESAGPGRTGPTTAPAAGATNTDAATRPSASAVPSGSSSVTGIPVPGDSAGGGTGGGLTSSSGTGRAGNVVPSTSTKKRKSVANPTAVATTQPAAEVAKPKVVPDGQACFDTAITGSLSLTEGSTTAGGPNYLHAPCHDIHLQLTAVDYRTYARSCLETSGGTTTSCSSWKLLQDGGAWNTMSTSVPDGTRWRLEMKAEGSSTVEFNFTG